MDGWRRKRIGGEGQLVCRAKKRRRREGKALPREGGLEEGGRLKGPELELSFQVLLPETNARKEDVQRLFNKLDFLSNNHRRPH